MFSLLSLFFTEKAFLYLRKLKYILINLRKKNINFTQKQSFESNALKLHTKIFLDIWKFFKPLLFFQFAIM